MTSCQTTQCVYAAVLQAICLRRLAENPNFLHGFGRASAFLRASTRRSRACDSIASCASLFSWSIRALHGNSGHISLRCNILVQTAHISPKPWANHQNERGRQAILEARKSDEEEHNGASSTPKLVQAGRVPWELARFISFATWQLHRDRKS